MKHYTPNRLLLMNPTKVLLSFSLLILCCINLSRAGNETVNNQISGSQILNNASVFVQDNNYPNVELSGGAKVASAKGYVIFSIDNASNLYFNTSHTVKVGLTIKSYDKNGTLQTVPSTVELEIGYSPTGSYKDRSVYVVNGSHKITATIQYIKDGTNTIIPPVSIPQNLRLEVEQSTERYYQFTTTSEPIMNSANLLIASNELEINWNTQAGAEEYELEWTYANNYDQDGGALDDYQVDFNFKNNSTRVRVSQNNYPISLVFDQGYVAYRVRAIGRSLTNLKELTGDWSTTLESGKISGLPSTHYHLIIPADRHEYQKNWQYSASYAEEGKKKEVVSYFDGSLRNRQSVTKLTTDNKAIIGETVYDYQGRGAIQILPTPIDTSVLKYYNAYNKSSAGGTPIYSRTDFDHDNAMAPCTTSTNGMSTTRGSSNYYSSSNPDKAGVQAYVPDAENYPFSQVEYTPDNTGRIRRQSGVGADHKLGTDHETKYYYGQPEQVQLDRLFGSEVGDFLHYKKNMVFDANKQISVSYLDQQGRVVATALAGESPDVVNALSTNNPATALTATYLKTSDANIPNSNREEGNDLIFSKELLVTQETDYKFYYDVEAPTFLDTCLPSPICYDCIYELEISLTDECGVDKFTPVRKLVGQIENENIIDSVCGSTLTFTLTSGEGSYKLVEDLMPGNYTLSKKLSISQSALDTYTDNYLRNNDCIKDYQEFLDSAMARIDTTACDISCGRCDTILTEYYDAHSDWTLGNPESETYDPNYDYMSLEEYNKQLKECYDPCKPANLCESQYQTLLSDVSPGGQYAKFEMDENGNVTATDPLSLFNPSNMLPNRGSACTTCVYSYWRNPVKDINGTPDFYYYDTDGSQSRIILSVGTDGNYYPTPQTGTVQTDVDGITKYIYPQDLANASDFINAFANHPEWAKSLVEYHPEYAYYEWCIKNSDPTFSVYTVSGTDYTSDSFDDWLRTKNTAASATSASLIVTSGPDLIASVLSKDPYFKNTSPNDGQGYAPVDQSTPMGLLLGSYNGSGETLEELAANAALCGTNYYGTCTADFMDGTTAQKDQQWIMYRDIYLAEKQKFQQQAANYHASQTSVHRYNGCIGIGTAFYNPFSGPWPFSWSDPSEPCGTSTWYYYKDKIKRFQNGADIMPGVDPFGDPQTASDIMTNTAEYNLYLQTGQCPVTNDLGNLLDNLAQSSTITTDMTLLNNAAFTKKLYDAVKVPNLPATSSFVEYYWVSSVSDEVLTVEFKRDGTSGDVDGGGSIEAGCPMTLTLPDGYSWNDVINFSAIQFTNESPSGTYNFTIYAYIDANTADATPAERVTVNGSTCLVLDGCTFPNHCGPSEMAMNMQNLFNTLLLEEKLDDADVSIHVSPYDGLFVDKLILPVNNTISAAEWTWDNGASAGTIDITIGESSNACVFSFVFENLSYDIGDVLYFANVRPNDADSSSFLIDGWVGDHFETITVDNGSEGCFNYKYCAPPPNMSCKGKTYQNNETFIAGLNAIASEGYLLEDATLAALPDFSALFNITPAPLQWDFTTVNNTTKELLIVINDDDENGECELTMEFADVGNTHDFSDIVGFANLEVPSAGNGQDFNVTAIFDDGTTQLINCSSDCVVLTICEQCTEGVADAPLMTMTFDSFDSGSPGFTSSRTYDATCNLGGPSTSKYYIVDDASTDCSGAGCTTTGIDHTNPGTGKFMIVHYELPALFSLSTIWEKTISGIQPYTDYEFSYWLQRCDDFSNCIDNLDGSMEVEIDGVASSVAAPTASNVWGLVSKSWNSGNNTTGTVTIKIRASYVSDVYGIDDILFTPIIQVPCIVTQTHPTLSPEIPYVNPCVQNLIDIAEANAEASYNFYIDSVENAFRENYLNHCKLPTENLKVEYNDSEHHFTLYYYDQAGNLVRTVPPQGVVLVTSPTDFDQIEQDRFLDTQTFFTQHSYITKYEYNSLNQLLRQSVPDHELMNKWEMNGLSTLPNGSNIYGMAFSSGDNGFVVGDDGAGNGIVYLTTDGGTTWSPASTLGVDDLQDIQMISSTGYAINDNGHLVKTIDGGSNWTVITSTGISTKLNDLYFTSASNGIIIGDNGVILITADGGSTWSDPTTVPASVGTRNLNALQYISSATTWYIAGDDGTVIKSTDVGVTWTSLSPALSALIDLNALDFTNYPQGFVAGINTNDNIAVVLKYNSGWTLQLQAAVNTTEFTAINVNTGGTGYVGGTNGKMFKTTNSGTSWAIETISGFTADITEMDATYGYATASDGSLLTLSGTWLPTASPVNTSLNGLYFTSSTVGYVVGDGGTIFAYNTGVWSSLTNINFNDLNDACFAQNSTTVGYAVGETGTIVKTTDAGSTWSTLTSGTSDELNAVCFTNANTGVIVGIGGLVLTTTNGTSFATQTSTTSENLNDIVNNGTKWVAVGENRAIIYSSNGTTWTGATISSGTETLYSVYFVGATGYACGSNGVVFKTTNDGVTWVATSTTSTTETLREVYFRDYLTGYVMGDNNTILKTIDGGTNWITETGSSGNYYTAAFDEDGNALIAGTGTNNLNALNDEAHDYSTRFWYDRLGRMIVSQNTKQFVKSPKAYSYTKYDALGRITEVGENATSTDVQNYANLHGVIGDDDNYTTWLASGSHTEVTTTLYDEEIATPIAGFTQENLRKRVSSVMFEATDDANATTFDHATHFSYDIHGNVNTLIQDNPSLAGLSPSQQYKKIDYLYDLVSGKVNEVKYQEDEVDAFYHKYEYDADNRITNVITSKDGVIWDKEANYFYYQHGPLARVELGDQKVQAMDYAYTIQGWIKGVNSNILKADNDIGKDGETTSTNLHQHVGRDAAGYSLNYFNGDYASIASLTDNFIASLASPISNYLGTTAPNLYNGNISSMVTAIHDLTTPSAPTVVPQLTAYKYDQLNRINRMKAYRDINLAGNAWLDGTGYDGSYETNITYDANGNILTLKRDGIASTDVDMDSLTYKYETINSGYTRNTNKLRSVRDNVSSGNYATDIDNQASNNYEYDEIGNLIADAQEEIDNIDWTVYGKIKSITRSGGSKPNLEFLYDASGNRIAKIVKPQASLGDESTWITTYYVRDAQGNVMSTYEKEDDTYKLKEQLLYGSSRLGTLNRDIDLVTYTSEDVVSRTVGKKSLELTNHLGSVLTTVSDRKLAHSTSGTTIDWYNSEILSSTDYYAFGDPMVGRTFTGANGYRFGFNGKEKTDEVSGNGNNYDYGFRIYNPRLGKFLSVDPLTASYPGLTPYQFASNTPIMAIDVDGLEAKLAIIMEWGSPELAMQHKNALEKEGFKVQIVASGRDAINFLTDHKVKGGDPIEQLTIITHGFDESAGSLGLPGTNDESGIYSPLGFATLAKQVGEEIATKKGTDAGLNEWAEGVEKMKENGAVSSTELASAINEIGFTDNGKVLLTGCNVGVSQEIVNKRNGEGEKNPFRLEKNFANIFAQDLKHDVIAASASFKGTGTSSPFNLTKEGTLFRAAAKWTVFKPDGTTKPLKQGNVINISTSK